MIQKISSKDIMDLLEESQNSIKDIELNVNDMKSELEKRLSIIKNVQEYTQESIIDIKELLSDGLNDSVENIILLSQQENAEGLYDKYGSIIHPAFIKTPTNVFNFGTITGKIFKNNANVKMNDTIKEEYTNMLMDDSITGKSVTFEEFDEPNITIEIEINPSDLRIDIYRSSGCGGQGVNTTDSAGRITHLPTNTVVTCQNERSQIQNKEQAMKVLKTRLYEMQLREQQEAAGAERRNKIGTGDRAEKIRTYNYPQNRVTDHRIGFTTKNLDRVMDGDLDDVINALIQEDQKRKLKGETEE